MIATTVSWGAHPHFLIALASGLVPDFAVFPFHEASHTAIGGSSHVVNVKPGKVLGSAIAQPVAVEPVDHLQSSAFTIGLPAVPFTVTVQHE